ncbi:MAG TPA: hypothetical protein VM680_17550 [Verrucomicrobiae bacterium]|nr:hypothetical protein [Verrucomicrobiae bacterium]
MAIPALDAEGFLPVGVHDCELEEIKDRFGVFSGSSRRPDLFSRLVAYFAEARAAAIATSIIVDGSFVTARTVPNDIDLVLVLKAGHDLTEDLNPADYNVVSRRRVHRQYGFDLLVAREGSAEHSRWIEFFQQVRLEPGRQKGILNVRL